MTFAFAGLRLDPDRRELTRDGEVVALEPQAFDVLVHLVRHRDRVVPKEELMDEIWGGRFVTEAAVTSRIKQARRAVGDDGRAQACIRTYHGRGYRFVADLDGVGEEPAPVRATPSGHEPRRVPVLTATYDGRPLAFQISGQGPPDLVLLDHRPEGLEREWADAERAALLGGLGAMARVVRSERQRGTPDPEARVQELLAVMDAAASGRAVLVATGDDGPVAVLAAATHPDRVAGLALAGTSATAGGADVTAALGAVRVPALVLHRRGDPDVEGSRHLAAHLGEAEFVELPGESAAGTGPLLDTLADLVEQAAAAEAPGRSLTALVGLAGGDLAPVVDVLVAQGGSRRTGPEGAVLVCFDGPATALRALGSRRTRGLLADVGVGVAIDEVDRSSPYVSGHGVDVARLFARAAEPGEVLLPTVIKDLLAGSGLAVEPRGRLDLPHVGPHPVHRWVRD